MSGNLKVAMRAAISVERVVTKLVPIALDQQLAAGRTVSALTLNVVHIAYVNVTQPGGTRQVGAPAAELVENSGFRDRIKQAHDRFPRLQ